jgi:hypothetical protein
MPWRGINLGLVWKGREPLDRGRQREDRSMRKLACGSIAAAIIVALAVLFNHSLGPVGASHVNQASAGMNIDAIMSAVDIKALPAQTLDPHLFE